MKSCGNKPEQRRAELGRGGTADARTWLHPTCCPSETTIRFCPLIFQVQRFPSESRFTVTLPTSPSWATLSTTPLRVKRRAPSDYIFGPFLYAFSPALGVELRTKRSHREVVGRSASLPLHPAFLPPVGNALMQGPGGQVHFVHRLADRKRDPIRIHHSEIPRALRIGWAMRHGQFQVRLCSALHPRTAIETKQIGNPYPFPFHFLPELRVRRTSLKLNELVTMRGQVGYHRACPHRADNDFSEETGIGLEGQSRHSNLVPHAHLAGLPHSTLAGWVRKQ